MAIHDWTRVEAGIFHHFHHEWISAIARALNRGILPSEFYALAEQEAVGFGPDVLTLQTAKPVGNNGPSSGGGDTSGHGVVLAPPKVRFAAESKNDFLRRKQSFISVKHISRDETVAIVEVISPGNKSSKNAFKALRDKVYELLEYKIHLLLLDLFPPTKRDPNGIHAAFWEDIANEEFTPPADKPLTLVAYEAGRKTKAYLEPVAVGDTLPDMPLFLEPGAHVLVPLDSTYQAAFAEVPRRWQAELE